MNQYQTSTESQNKFFASIMNTAKNIMEKASYFVIDFHPSSVGFRWGDDQQEVINYDSSDISQFINEYTKNNRTVVFTDNEKFQNFFRDCVQRFCQNVPNQLVGLYSECSSLAPKSRQYHNSDATILEGSEDNNNSNIAVILIPMFVVLVLISIVVFHCNRGHFQRRSVNRREPGALEEGDEQSHPGEMECLPVQGEVEQHLVNGEEEDHLSPATDNEVTSSSSSGSNTLSRTGSSAPSRSGAVSRTGSSASIEEDGQSDSDLEEAGSDNSQRSSSPANAPQELQGTSVQNVRGGSRSSWPKNIVNQVVGCLRNSC